MKNSAVLASLLFGAFAVAAPLDPRAMVYKTEVVVETVVVYTTVYDDQPVAEATPTAGGYFYEQPKHKHSSAAAIISTSSSSSQAPAYTPPVVAPKPSSTSVAPVPQVPTPTPQAPTPTPAPVETPKPTSAAYVAPAPVVSSAAPVVSSAAPVVSSVAPAPSAPANGGATGGSYNSDMTVYDLGAAKFGGVACGKKYASSDADYVAAVSQGLWDAMGGSTWDQQTGDSLNPWCGQKAKVVYNGKPVTVTIVDLCAGCNGPQDIDLSWAAWNDVTNNHLLDRFKVSWSKVS